MVTWIVFGLISAVLIYGALRLAQWEHKIIIDWLDGDRSTPPPSSAFFPESIARQWWEDYRRRQS